MAGRVALMGHSFSNIAAPIYGPTWQFILSLNRLNKTSNNTHQILLQIARTACSPVPNQDSEVSSVPCEIFKSFRVAVEVDWTQTRPNKTAAESMLPVCDAA